MIETSFDMTTADGQMPTWTIRPDGDGPYPVVLFLMDAPGMRQEILDMSCRLATAGYYVMTAQSYYRDVREFNVFDNGDRDRMFELMGNLTNEMANADAGAMINHASNDPAADASKVGVVGYCMSGPFAIMNAAAHNDCIRAAASIHGVRLAVDEPDSPHRHLDAINAEIYVACAETDSYAPPEMIAEFESALENSTATGTVEWYSGTEHGFAYQERPQYDRAASEQHWERLHHLFATNLR